MERQMLKIREAVKAANEKGFPISEYAIREWVRTGKIPARKAGRTILLYWPNVEAFLTCADGLGDAAAIHH